MEPYRTPRGRYVLLVLAIVILVMFGAYLIPGLIR
jgi:Sec-independent protein translocase protein TatA